MRSVPELDQQAESALAQLTGQKREISATDIRGIIDALERLSRGVWLEAWGQVLETFYDPTPQTKDSDGLFMLDLKPATRNQQIVRGVIMVYDPSMTLMSLDIGQTHIVFVPEARGVTILQTPFLAVKGGDVVRLKVVAGGAPSRLGLTLTGTEVPMGAAY